MLGPPSKERLQRPTQAVILAGGRGTRLRPITNTRPKPMVEFHGKPFLEYIVEMLRDQGFERILMLLGYMPEAIQSHFEDGDRWEVEIEYSVTGPDDLTGHRMKVAADLLDPCFLLLYCDNYWPMRFDDMWDRFASADVPAMGAEPVVQLHEVLGARGEFDVRRVRHLTEADDHARVRQPVVPHHLARHPLGPQIQIVLVAEGHVDGGDARREGADGLQGEAPVQRGDRRPHRVQVRIAVLHGSVPHRSAVRHVRTP